MSFARFMASPVGRILRIVAGLALMVIGLAWVGGVAGAVLAVVGLAPLLAGSFNLCLIALLIGAPFRGASALTLERSK
jgi:hypothetical protein